MNTNRFVADENDTIRIRAPRKKTSLFPYGSGRKPQIGVAENLPRMPAFRARPYITPEERAKQPEKPSIAGPIGIAAALKAEAPKSPSYIRRAQAECERNGADPDDREDIACFIEEAGWKRIDQRATRKVRMRRKARRGWA